MLRLRISTLLLLITLAVVLSVPAYAVDRVACTTTWDEFYLYALIEVQDPNVESTNTKHMSNPGRTTTSRSSWRPMPSALRIGRPIPTRWP